MHIRVKTNTRGFYHYPISYAVGAGKILCARAVDDTFTGFACVWPRLTAGTPGLLKRARNSVRRLLNGSSTKSPNSWAHFSSWIGASRSKPLLRKFWVGDYLGRTVGIYRKPLKSVTLQTAKQTERDIHALAALQLAGSIWMNPGAAEVLLAETPGSRTGMVKASSQIRPDDRRGRTCRAR